MERLGHDMKVLGTVFEYHGKIENREFSDADVSLVIVHHT